ncbi:type I-E CRISPR-associated protein Cse2/CasB [Streptomyces sp. V2]|uniref:Type I-E CRISPR-associated protein Cse2/CasB n=1 Tax=Streptomyces niveiscabiei TaxID=164115 RepID=A0ABW9I6S5_9ACTN|nr:type I-E CRISPR-associated protein Cse2/CasB [Streptomyces sp. V2]PWG11006.1 type I-E CRISPR-associated protein Cse2/CasB [Streptomyces sp. V2]
MSKRDAGYRLFFWEEFTQAQAQEQAGELGGSRTASAWAERGLRALRDGLGREPGEVPAMRRLHRVELTDARRSEWQPTDSYRAEHVALTLFGLHQTSGGEPVHRRGVGLGTAVRALTDRALSENAAERRLEAAASAQDVEELAQHLRGLIPLLRRDDIGLDYTRLYQDLTIWQRPDNGRVLRAWGLQYTDPENEAPADGQIMDGPPYWATVDLADRKTAARLAALRSGTGREAGTVPAMWPVHRTRISTRLRTRGALTRSFAAEHTALTLFGLHQQGRDTSVHTPGLTPGGACRLLLARGSEADRTAIERRLGTLLTSLDTGELAQHLRGLVPLLRRAHIGLDYDALHEALLAWDDTRGPERQSWIRTAWDRDFRTETTPRT